MDLVGQRPARAGTCACIDRQGSCNADAAVQRALRAGVTDCECVRTAGEVDGVGLPQAPGATRYRSGVGNDEVLADDTGTAQSRDPRGAIRCVAGTDKTAGSAVAAGDRAIVKETAVSRDEQADTTVAAGSADATGAGGGAARTTRRSAVAASATGDRAGVRGCTARIDRAVATRAATAAAAAEGTAAVRGRPAAAAAGSSSDALQGRPIRQPSGTRAVPIQAAVSAAAATAAKFIGAPTDIAAETAVRTSCSSAGKAAIATTARTAAGATATAAAAGIGSVERVRIGQAGRSSRACGTRTACAADNTVGVCATLPTRHVAFLSHMPGQALRAAPSLFRRRSSASIRSRRPKSPLQQAV